MKLLIAIDGSELAVHAAQRADSLVAEPESVTVLFVLTEIPGDDAGGIEGPTQTPEEAEREWRREEADAADAVRATIAVLPASWQARARGRTEAGDPAAMVAWVARHEDSDLVVVGSHGRSALKRVLVGSVSEHIVRHAPCPVLVVRAGAEHFPDPPPDAPGSPRRL